jgi:serine/threonine protein kinase
MKLCLVCNFQFEDEQEFCPKDSSRLIVLSKDPLVGKSIQDRYKIDSVLAKGSMGTIYKASQEPLGREVAIKVLHDELVSDEVSLKRFQTEAKAASRLNHPHITTLYDYGVLPSGQPYMVMELLKGKNLADLIKRSGCLTVDEILLVFDQVCQALSEAHKCGVVHRDIKPENIVIEDGPDGVLPLKVVDFGIAKFFQESEDTFSKITKTGTICGSPTYMSPEQCDGLKIDHRSDVYSLGVVLYEALTGKAPFGSKDVYTVMSMHVKEPPPSLNVARPDLDFPPFLESVVQKSLTKQVDDRYQSIDEFWKALQSACGKKEELLNVFPSSNQIAELIMKKQSEFVEAANSEMQDVFTKALSKKLEVQAQTQVSPDEKEKKRKRREKKKKKEDETTLILNTSTNSHIYQEGNRRTSISIPITVRFMALFQQILPGILTIFLFASLLFLVINEPTINKIMKKGGKLDSIEKMIDIEGLVAQNKLDQARSLLETKAHFKQLTNSEQKMLNSIYLRLAKKEAKNKHYTNAVNLLKQISSKESKSSEVQSLLAKYATLAK